MTTARRTLWAGAATLVVASGLTALGPAADAGAQTPPVPDPVQVKLVDVPADPGANPPTPAGLRFEPSTVVLVAGQSVVIENQSNAQQEVEAADASFDSGVIPPGGAFVAAVDATGTIPFATVGSPAATGRLVFGLAGLPGASTGLARGAVPRLQPPPADPADFGDHPDYGYPTSRTQILLLPTTTATVGQVNAALASVGATIISGQPLFGTLGVAIPDTGNHVDLLDALTTLRANPAFESRITAGANPGEQVGDPSGGAVAPVWQGKQQTVPAPYNPQPKDLNWIFAPRGTNPFRVRGDYGFLQAEVPQAWNLLDLARQRAASSGSVETVVLDVGFGQDHPDLDLITTDAESFSDHGMHVAGIVGARYDNREGDGSQGTSGVNPVARLHAVEVGGVYAARNTAVTGPRAWSSIDFTADYDRVLAEKRPNGLYPRLGVINASFGGAVFNSEGATKWAKKVNGKRCGEYSGDDTPVPTGAAAKPCLPSTLDSFRADFEALATVSARILDAAYTTGVVITKAAGNDNDSFCLDATGEVVACATDDVGALLPGLTVQPLPAIFTNELAKARDLYARSQFPLLVVGAMDSTTNATSFSQPPQYGIQGYTVDLLAPGFFIRSTTTPDIEGNADAFPVQGPDGEWYGELSGTSMAAPYVAGAVGYLLALLPQVPGESATDRALRVVKAVKDSAREVDPQNYRLSVWDVVFRQLGLRAFADQSDYSPDGSRRVVRTAEGDTMRDTLATVNPDGRNADLGPQRAQPDGKVDLRDVRAFRDAWLQGCLDGSIAPGGAIACPPASSIVLDGGPDHPKKDGNGDNCVLAAPGSCLIGEARYSRFDLNADGRLSLNDKRDVPVDATTGAVTTAYSPFTDLELLDLALYPGEFFDGWARDDVANGTFLRSADVTLDLAQVPAGTTGIKVTAKSDAGTISTNVSLSPAGVATPGVLSVPVADGGSEVELAYSATRNGTKVISGTATTSPLRYGEDATVALCEVKLTTAGPDVLAYNQTALFRVSTASCTPGATPPKVAGPVAFTVTPVDPATSASSPTLGTPSAEVDPSNTARTPITAGTSAGTFLVRATVTGPGGEVVQAQRLVRVVPRIEVRYRWESEVTSVSQTATTDWPDVVPGRPDCREIPDSGCIVNATTSLTAGAPTPLVTREGTITLDASGVHLDESVGGRAGSLSISYGWESLPAGTSESGSRTFTFGPIANQSVTDVAVPVELSLDGDGSVVIDGFRFLADVPYKSGVVDGATTGPNIQPERFGVPGELLPLSVPQPSGIQHGPDPNGVTRIRSVSGSYVPTVWCGTVTTPIVRTPGYRLATANPLIDGAVVLGNDPVYAAGKVPMPAGTGSYQRRIRVAFTAAQTGPAADPVLPTCTGSSAPTAAFDVAPQPDGVLHEGDAIRFLDRSTDPDGDLASWSWSFGRSDRNPVLVPGLEDGATEVSLRVADTGGRFNRVFQTLNAANVLPTVTPVTPLVTVPDGDRATIAVRLDDPGPTDRTRLNLRVSEGGTDVVLGEVFPAGTARITLPVLPLGVHDLTVWVYDGNRQFVEVRASVTVVVVPEEVASGPGDARSPVEIGTCAASVPLSADEAELLRWWNTARERADLPPLALSAELSAAASSLANASLGILGLAPTADVGKATADAGYAGREVRALPFSRDVDPFDVLEGLRASEPGTVFSLTGRMVGVAKVAQGTDVKWVVVVGGIVDCEVEEVLPGSAPLLLAASPAGPLVEGARIDLPVTASDTDGDLAEVRVDWGDGTVAGTTHRYRDDGVYSVRVTALDEQGNVTTSEPIDLTVVGAAPEIDVVAGELVAGVAGTLELAAADPAESDRPLQLAVSTVPAGAASYTGTIDGGRTLRVQPATAGPLDVTVKVTDNDGVSTTVTKTFTVLPAPGTPPTAPPNVVAPPAAACPSGTAGVALRAQAADFLTQANAFRTTFGAPSLAVSKELQLAAEQQLADMTSGRYFAHLDSLGRTPLDRARANGYSGGVGENIALRFVNGTQVLLGWRSSPVHLENLLDPVWNATGVAVGNTADGVLWVQVFGTVPTCPTADRSPVPGSVVLANPPVDAAAPVAAWSSLAPATVTDAAPLAAALPAPAAAPVAAQQPAPTAAVAAFTVSDLTPTAGQNVTVTNRSRDAGTDVSGTLTFGSVSNRVVAPSESFQRAVFSAQDIALTAAGATARTSVTGSGSYVPQVTILGPADGAAFDQGAAIPVQVLVTDGTSTPLSGVRVRARVNPPGADYVIGATGADGKATLTVRPAVAGPVVLEVQAETVGADTWIAATGRNLTIVGNTAPAFPTIDPLTVELNQPLRLWVPEAVDADVPISYSWDLDGNGTFGDLGIAARDTQVPWADVATVICGGVCTADQAETLTVRATDRKGASTDATVTVTPVRDFQVAVNPQRLSLPPGGSTTVGVTVVTTSGFARPVTLTASGLPDGITASFFPETINPGELGNLTLSVSPTYNSTAPIPLSVTGTATDPVRGTIARTATPTVSVVFSLEEICKVSWSGTIRNAVTGAPVAGATVRVPGLATVTTGADGRWSVPVVPVAGNNGPLTYSIEVERTGYHALFNTQATAVCDANRTDIDIAIHEKLFVPVKVKVRDADSPTVVPAGTTVDVSRFSSEFSGPVDVDGRATALVSLNGPDNRAAAITVAATAPGYHYNSAFRSISQGALPDGVTADVNLTRICSARFVGGTVVDADGRPVPGARVTYGGLVVIADANARYTIDRDVALGGRDNTPVNVGVNGAPPSDRFDLVAGFGTRLVSQCGERFEITITLPLNPNGPARYATLRGRFLSPTGVPIGTGLLSINGNFFYGERDGTYSVQLFVGRQNAITGAEPSPAFFGVVASTNGTDQFGFPYWWPTGFNVTLAANEVRTYDIVLDPVRYGSMTGVVVDAGTGAPLANQTLDLFANGSFGVVTTGADGRFAGSGLRQAQSGITTGFASTRETGAYWSGRASGIFSGDPATVDLVVPVIRKCAPTTVTGLVLTNASPNAPLSGVTVESNAGGQAVTGDDGRFSFSAGPFFENAPRQATITASKEGFVTATRTVFLFCGATLVVDFAPQSPTTGTITGTVTKADGTPVKDVFVGTEYGGGTTTLDDGTYKLEGAPPNPDGSARTWKVTAVPTDASGLLPATVSVAVTGGQTSTANLTLQAKDTVPVNRPPVAAITPNGTTAPEGTLVTFDGSSSSDPDGDQLSFTWDLDADGSVDGLSATFPVQLFAPGPRTVKLTVADGKGLSASTQVTLTYTNVAPTVVAGDDVTVGPDGVFSRSGRFEDPGAGDAFTSTVDWGDGGGFVPLQRFGRTLDLDHTFPGVGTYRVVVRVCDAANGCGEGSFAVTVAASPPPNQPPVALVSGPLDAIEGAAVTYDASASSDPDAQPLSFAWDLDADGVADDATGPTVSFTALGLGTRTLVVAVTDSAGATSVASLQLTVRNAPPAVDPIPDQRLAAGVPVSLRATVRDSSAAPAGYIASADWGDGAGPIPAPFVPAGAAPGASGVRILRADGLAAVGTVELLHAYALPGEYRVTVTVCDTSCSEVVFRVVVTDGGNVATTDLVTTIAWAPSAPAGAAAPAAVTVENRGATAAVPVVVLALPAAVTVTGVAGEGWACDLPTRCTALAPLAPGASATFRVDLVVSALASGQLDLVAGATSAVADTVPVDNVARAVLSVAAPPQPAPAEPPVGRLPSTGAAPLPAVWLGLGAMGLGLSLLGLSRRRVRGSRPA